MHVDGTRKDPTFKPFYHEKLIEWALEGPEGTAARVADEQAARRRAEIERAIDGAFEKRDW